MFTGIIKHTGTFKGYGFGKRELIIQAPSIKDKLDIGESLAINGVCLSLTKKENDDLHFNLSEETLKQTTMGSLRHQDRLNLELSLTLSTPLGGHLVTGHVDGKGKVLQIRNAGEGRRISVSFPPELKPYFVPKGSVALNGVSLTIALIKPSAFEVELIPLTLRDSNLDSLKAGDAVNIECDMIGKYVYNWVSRRQR